MAFFFTMPIRRDDADERDDAQLRVEKQQRPTMRRLPRRRQSRQNRDRMYEIFKTQDSENDVDNEEQSLANQSKARWTTNPERLAPCLETQGES